ncbi:hypothetical protein Tco_0326672 [Tanacetum coccineum]
MVALESCPKHNMIAYLEKTDGNAEFHEIIDFLTRSSIHYALTLIAGKPVTISEASIRSDLLFDDADGIDILNNQAIFDTIQLMGFISVFLANRLKNVPVPLDHFPINALTSKVFSFMVKKGKYFSGKVTPLFPSMLVQSTEDEGEVLERPSESQPIPSLTHPSEDQPESQPDPPPRPSSSIPTHDSNPKGSGRNHRVQVKEIKDLKAQIKKLKKKARPVITHHKAWMKSVSMKTRLAGKKSMKKKWMQKEFVSKQGRKTAKSKPTEDKDEAFNDLDAMDYIETEDADNEKGVSTEDQVSIVKSDEDESDTQTAPTTTSTTTPTVFGDDETIAEFLVSMSYNKAKQKGVEIKDAEDSDRPRPTSTRPVLTLKPLPKIDPKDKGKKVLKEEAESDAESEGVNEAERKFAQLANNEEIARKARIEADSILAARLQEE